MNPNNDEFFEQFHQEPPQEFAQDLLARLNVIDSMSEKTEETPVRRSIFHRLRGTPAALIAAAMALFFAGMIFINSMQIDSVFSQADENPLTNLQPITAQNVSDLQQLQRLGRGTLYDMAWSPDESTIAVASGSGVYLHSATDFSDLGMIPGTEGEAVQYLSYSQEGTRLVAYLPSINEILVWESANSSEFEIIDRIPTENEVILDVMFNEAGDQLAVSYCVSQENTGCLAEYGIYVREIGTGNLLQGGSPRDTNRFALSPDWSTLAIVEQSSSNLVLEDFATGEELIRLEAGTLSGGIPMRLAFSPDSTQLAMNVNNAGTLYIFDVETLLNAEPDTNILRETEAIVTESPSNEGILWAWLDEFSANGSRVVANDINGRVMIWSVAAGELVNVIEISTAQTPQRIGPVRSNSDGTQVVTMLNGILAQWDVDTGEQLNYSESYHIGVNQFSFTDDHGSLVVGGRGNLLAYATMYDLTAQTITPQYIYPPEDATYLARPNINADGTQMVYSSVLSTGSSELVIYDTATGLSEALPDQRDWENQSEAYFDAENDVFMVTDFSDTEIHHWQREGETIRHSVELQADEDNTYFTPTLNTTPGSAPFARYIPFVVDTSNRILITSVCDRQSITVNQSCTANVGVWDRATGDLLMILTDSDYENNVYETASTFSLSADGNTLAVGSCFEYYEREYYPPAVLCQSSGVRLWDVTTAYDRLETNEVAIIEPFARLEDLPAYPIPQVGFSPSSEAPLLAVANGESATFYMIDATSEELTFISNIEGAAYPQFSPDGELLAVSRNGVVELWGIPAD